MRACRKYWLIAVSSLYSALLRWLMTSGFPFIAMAPVRAKRCAPRIQARPDYSPREKTATKRKSHAFAKTGGPRGSHAGWTRNARPAALGAGMGIEEKKAPADLRSSSLRADHAAFAIIGRSRRRATASWKISEARSSQFPQQSAYPVARRTWSNECAPLSAASRIARSVTALQMQTYMALPGSG